MRGTMPERWLDKVLFSDGCWEWQAAKTPQGYGKIGSGSSDVGTQLAHRFGYELLKGSVPGALQLDHLCRNRACVNPDHLEPVTAQENVRRGVNGIAKVACANGHEYAEGSFNIEFGPRTPKGLRRCLICRRETDRRRYSRSGNRHGGAAG